MKQMLKLALPIGLGVAAGALNFWAQQEPTYDYVTVKEPIQANATYEAEHLGSIKLPVVIPGAIQSKEVGVLLGAIVPRDLEKGDFVFLRDIAASSARLELQKGEI